MIRHLPALLLLLPTLTFAITAEDLPIEDRVGQLLMVWFEGEEVNEEAHCLLEEARVGSIIYYKWANGLTSPEQIKNLSTSLQELAEEKGLVPLLIATDQEGGIVSRLQHGFTDFPGNGALGNTESPHLAYLSAKAMGDELKSVGINYNLAPIVDINNNPKNPIIGIRSFGSDPQLVTTFGEAAIDGYLASGIIPCLKHFPGHGDVSIDSHNATPIVEKTLEELNTMELIPYMKLSHKSPSIMTVHILFPHLDPFQTATLSTPILQDILRNKMEYRGVIITDSLTMKGASKKDTNLEQTALEAFLGGNDILLTGGRTLLNKSDGEARIDVIIRIYYTLLNAVNDGTITEKRLNESVNRILKLKEKAGLFKEPEKTQIDFKKHEKLAKQIAYHAQEIPRGVFPLSMSSKKVAVLAPNVLKSRLEKTLLTTLNQDILFYYFDYINPTEEEITKILEHLNTFDTVIFFSYNAWKRPKQLQFLETIATSCNLTALVATGEDKDLDLISRVQLKIATYSPSIPSLQVATECITGYASPLELTLEESLAIGMKIWMNTSSQDTRLLTHWKEGEEFPSLGIGHFTWPPYTYRGPFSKGSFHELLAHLQDEGVPIPSWLEKSHFSPWTTRAQFLREINDNQLTELRTLLCNTIPHQARFMTKKVNDAYLAMLRAAPKSQRKQITKQFFRIASVPNGPYIIADYINFQHCGTDPKEQYNEKGWGLLQVLTHMNTTSDPIADFTTAATHLLTLRVENAPKDRPEATWLPTWLRRLSTY